MWPWVFFSLAVGAVIAFSFLVNDSLPQRFPYLSFLGITVFWPIGLAALLVIGIGHILLNLGIELKDLLLLTKKSES
jgi:bacteriorhodopsin